MARHFNQLINEQMRDTFGFKEGDTPLDEVVPIVTPVKDIKQPLNLYKTATFTTSTVEDTYITGIWLSAWSNITATTQGSSTINCTTDTGQALIFGGYTDIGGAGAGAFGAYIDLSSTPLKLRRGTAVTVGNDNGQGYTVILGYTQKVRS